MITVYRQCVDSFDTYLFKPYYLILNLNFMACICHRKNNSTLIIDSDSNMLHLILTSLYWSIYRFIQSQIFSRWLFYYWAPLLDLDIKNDCEQPWKTNSFLKFYLWSKSLKYLSGTWALTLKISGWILIIGPHISTFYLEYGL